jgi:hypothetical protein
MAEDDVFQQSQGREDDGVDDQPASAEMLPEGMFLLHAGPRS